MNHDTERRGPGRPSLYCQETADAILDRLANGESLIDICETEGMPTRTTIRDWRKKYPEFASAIARARADGTEARIEADERIAMEMLRPKEGGPRYEPAAVREFLNYRRWVNESYNPTLLPRNRVELSGGLDLRSKSTEELVGAVASVLAGVARRDGEGEE